MTPDGLPPNDEAFLALCTALRVLGATSVECGDRRATFTAQIPKGAIPKPMAAEEDLDRFPTKR